MTVSTGYTAPLHERDMTFEEFVWRCAHAMAASDMYDRRVDAEITDVQPKTKYDEDRLAEAQAERLRITAMTDEETEATVKASAAEMDRRVREGNEERAVEKARFRAMLSKVEAWKPPTPGHAEFREFMIEQLTGDLKYLDPMDMRSYLTTGAFWRSQELERLEKRIVDSIKAIAEKRRRAEEDNAWLRALRASVPQPKGA